MPLPMPEVKEKKHLLESLGCGAAFLDYDNDGDHDLYLVNGWKIKGPGDIVRGSNMLCRNNGNGTFTDAAHQSGVANGTVKPGMDEARHLSAGAPFFDYDNDGNLDLIWLITLIVQWKKF